MSGDLLKYAPAWVTSRWAKTVAGLLLAVLIFALLAPYLLNVDRYRGTIADMISMQTGRKVTLGRLRATFLPTIGFSVDGFQMANPVGFVQGPNPMIAADEIHGALAFWPLALRHELRVISLDLEEPRLTLLVDEGGRNNYTFPPRHAAPAATPKKPAGPAPASLTLMVDQVTLHDADIFYGTIDRRGQAAATVNIAGLDVQLRQLALQPLRIRDWQADAELVGTQLVVAGWNTPVAFESGSVTLRDNKLDASFTLQFGKAARVQGTLDIADIEHAVPQFDVKTGQLDVDALLSGATAPQPVIPARGPRPASAPALAPAARARVVAGQPATGLSRLVAQGHLAADHIREGTYTAGPLTADLRIYNDRTEVWPFTLRMADGAVELTARTDRRQVPQRFSANIEARNLNTEEILHDSPQLRGKFAGAAEMDLQLIGSIEPQWTQSLTGKGQFAIRNGRIAGFNLAGDAQSLANLAGISGDTPFTRITGDLDIHDGRIASRQIHMDSPRGTLDLKGSCGFYGSLDYEGQMITQLGGPATGSANGARDLSGLISNALGRNMGQTQVTVPFVLKGTLQKPQLRPGRVAPKFAKASQSDQPGHSVQPQQTATPFPNLFGH
jgi:uncharacterized protein involved in outer membrane biogenesis